MARAKAYRSKTVPLLALGLIFLFTIVATAQNPPFAGKWRGESRAVTAPAGGAVGPTTGGNPAATVPPPAPAGVEARATTAPGSSPRAGSGGGRGGFGGGGGAAQKVTLNLKQSKEGKVSGNITFGESDPVDVKDGKADGNTLAFKAGRSPQPIYDYKGELKGNELILTRSSTGPRDPALQIVLSKK